MSLRMCYGNTPMIVSTCESPAAAIHEIKGITERLGLEPVDVGRLIIPMARVKEAEQILKEE